MQPGADYRAKAGDNIQRCKDVGYAEAGVFVADFFARSVKALGVSRSRKLIADARSRR